MCLPPSGHLTLNHHTHCTEETEAQGISHVPRPAPREAQGWDLNTDTCLAAKFMFNHTGQPPRPSSYLKQEPPRRETSETAGGSR